jgi:para-nitrobenzyl esterase
MILIRALLLAALATPAAAQTLVDAPAGRVSGVDQGKLAVFKGIPYAQAPVGERRWRAPQPLPRWTGTRPATDFGPACIQPSVPATSVYAPTTPLPTSEDCLSLNIWTPKQAKKAPVLVWIHGGALLTGSSREALYDGRHLADRGLVVVSINYRLGALGYLAHPALSAEDPRHVSGNYGLLDQVAALDWVRRNIAAFGGDPANVTIAGESAGALSATYLMVTPAARPLFRRAIVQSGYLVTTPALRTTAFGLPPAEAIGAMALKATDAATLRAMDAQTLTNGAAAAGFLPFANVDGVVLPEQPVVAFDAGHQAKVSVLAGFNQGEIRSLRVLAAQPPATAEAYGQGIRARYGDMADAFLRLYPAATYRESILLTPRDALYGWTSERLVRSQTAAGQPSYLYLWDHGYPAMDDANLHAFHASELPFTFGTLPLTGPNWPKVPDTAAERRLSDAMLDYWTSFAATGTPRSAAGPAWPAFAANRPVMHFTASPRVEPGLLAGMYDFNEAVVRRRRAAGTIPWNWNVGLNAPLPTP